MKESADNGPNFAPQNRVKIPFPIGEETVRRTNLWPLIAQPSSINSCKNEMGSCGHRDERSRKETARAANTKRKQTNACLSDSLATDLR